MMAFSSILADSILEHGSSNPKVDSTIEDGTWVNSTIEDAVASFLSENNFDFVAQKRIMNYRVDFQVNVSWGRILLEVDENQHKHYNQEAEIKRMNDIMLSCMMDNVQTVLLRYNTDTDTTLDDQMKCELMHALSKTYCSPFNLHYVNYDSDYDFSQFPHDLFNCVSCERYYDEF